MPYRLMESPHLYQITEEFLALQVALEETGEWSEETEARWAALGDLEAEKVDAYRAVCFRHETDAAILKAQETELRAEADALRAKRKVKENALANLKRRLYEHMQARGLTVLEGRIWKAKIEGNGGLRALELHVPVEALPARFHVVELRPNEAAIRLALEQAENATQPNPLAGLVTLHTRGSHLTFR